MKIKFLFIENGKITLTKKELEDLLEESYRDGVEEGRKSNYHGLQQGYGDTVTTPYWTTRDYVTCSSDSALSSTTYEVSNSAVALDGLTANDCAIEFTDSTIATTVSTIKG